jgi:hypothetical protein
LIGRHPQCRGELRLQGYAIAIDPIVVSIAE